MPTVTLHAGAGGTEAFDLRGVSVLFRMYYKTGLRSMALQTNRMSLDYLDG